MLKQERGVTLVALVITIIVLLILAGVSIAMLTGDNGILTRANDAKAKNSQAEVLEKVNMELNAQLANAMAGYKFDTEAKMKLNLGLSETVTTIAGYTVTVTGPTKTEYDTSDSVSIAITDTNSEFANATGTVSYDADNKVWTVTPVKAN